MQRKFIPCALVIGLAMAAGVEAKFTTAAAAAQAARMPVFEVDPGWPKVPPQFKVGDPSSIGIDAQDNAYVLSRPRTLKPEDAPMKAPPVMVFDPAGNYLRGWGGDGQGYQWPEREHGILIDAKGFVWLGGNSCPENGLPGLRPVADDQLLKFTRDGKFVLQIGKSNASKGNADTMNLHRPADVQLHVPTNELFVADGYGNHRVAVFDADNGRFKRMWGAFGNRPVDANSCEVVSYKTFTDPGPQQFSIVHAIRVAKDGTVYVADREHRRVQMFDKDGKYMRQLVRSDDIFARNLAFSPDAEQQFLYVGYGKGVAVVDRKTMAYVGTIQPPGTIGAGHHINTDSKGNIYIAQTTAGMQRLLYKGMSQ